MDTIELLRLVNTVLEAAIVILISSVLLYSVGASLRNRVTRASNLLLTFTVIAYLGDLFLTQMITASDMERWLRAEWIGIAFVPSAYLHLSSALLKQSGSESRWHRFGVWSAYFLSAVALSLAAFTDLLVQGTVVNFSAPQLHPGKLFPIFVILFGFFIIWGAILQFEARKRTRTATMRRRITYLIASAFGPAISVFPYLVITGQRTIAPPELFWLIQVLGNSIVGLTIFFLTYSVAFFGFREPDRVVRLRLVKFLARGPLVAFGVLVLLVIVGRAGRFLSLPADKATPFVVVGGIVLFQWLILLIKPKLESWFYFSERAQLVRIQELRDRVLTTNDLRKFLENILASVCELLQVETAFVASFTTGGKPKVELIVGDLEPSESSLSHVGWESLKMDLQSRVLPTDGRIEWNGYWILSLRDPDHQSVLGILGVQSPKADAELPSEYRQTLERLAQQAASILKDQLLQQEVFSAMEGLLQRVEVTRDEIDLLLSADMVRDALSHYWGGPKLTQSPLLRLQVVHQALEENQGNALNAMRTVLLRAIESLRPEGERNMTTGEWILYNILELKFLKGYKVRDVAHRLAMSESDLYRKQRIAIEAVARAIADMERTAKTEMAEDAVPNHTSNDKEN